MTRTRIAKAFVVTVTVSVLTISPPLAQAPAQPDTSGAAPTVSSSQILGAQGPDEWLVSQLRGTAVVGSDNQKIGEVMDVLLDRSGQARAFIVGVAGIMGPGGAKEIAIDLTQFQEIPVRNGARAQLKVPMTREQLALVPEFKPLPLPEATTGSAPGSPPERSR